jgi:hypothetical protein
MQRKTRSLLEELDEMYHDRDRHHIVESRGNNIIQSAIHLLEMIDRTYDRETADNLQRKLLNAIRTRDPERFRRTIRRQDEN